MTGRAENLHIIWHFGFQKTATTSFQIMINQNRENLPGWLAIRASGDATQELRKGAQSVFKAPPGADTAQLETAARKLRDAALSDGATTLIVSDENTIGGMLNAPFGSIFEIATRIMPIVAAAVRPARSTFVFYTRDFYHWLVSAHNQAVKNGRCAQDFEEWRASLPFPMDWEANLDPLRKATGVEIKCFDLGRDLANGQQPGSQILTYAGLDHETISSLKPGIRRNPSLSAGAMQFMLKLNRSDIDDAALKHVRQAVVSSPECFT